MTAAVDVRFWLTARLTRRERREALEDLSPEERARHARFVFDGDRRDFAAAHALVRRTLSAHAGCAADEWAFVAGPHGKPELSPSHPNANLAFNLTHTSGLVACAVTSGADVGIDGESIDRGGEVLSVGTRVFTAAEMVTIESLPANQRGVRAVEIWTLKEAYLKATGMGLAHRKDVAAFIFDRTGAFHVEGVDATEWQFAIFKPYDRYCLAVAMRDTNGRRRQVQLGEYAAGPHGGLLQWLAGIRRPAAAPTT